MYCSLCRATNGKTNRRNGNELSSENKTRDFTIVVAVAVSFVVFSLFVCLKFNYTDFQAANDPNENDIINLDPIVFRDDAVEFPTHRTELRRTKRINGPFTRRR